MAIAMLRTTWGNDGKHFLLAVASIGLTTLFYPAMTCACGYQTPRTLLQTGSATLAAWTVFSLAGRKKFWARIVVLVAVVYASAIFGKNLADVLWLSPHAESWSR